LLVIGREAGRPLIEHMLAEWAARDLVVLADGERLLRLPVLESPPPVPERAR
jgi:hypothetical protein